MSFQYQYRLQPYAGIASRHRCPKCNKPRTFTLYIDIQTGQPVSDTVGKCDRLVQCGYHLSPKQYFEGQRGLGKGITPYTSTVPVALPSFISQSLVTQSLAQPERNNLIMFIADCIGAVEAEQLVTRYLVGRSNHWPGATVFWQTDITGQSRAGKIMLYNRETGRRVKEPFNHVTWVHKVMQLPGYNLQQCFFGEHLLQGNNKPIAIVESEKTAMIASVYYPGFIWLACGGLSNLTPVNCRVLQGRQVMLVPDLDGYDEWLNKARSLHSVADIRVSDMLQTYTSDADKEQGLDLADYLLRYDYREWRG